MQRPKPNPKMAQQSIQAQAEPGVDFIGRQTPEMQSLMVPVVRRSNRRPVMNRGE
jgi:hypothetical protein